ncbi:hypothetical protein [Micromonospora luteifusca]|uniref:hypothetical protein n=1 Tax=Micromonospora luteifusca TaxID=709860 RepID=UPI0033B65839
MNWFRQLLLFVSNHDRCQSSEWTAQQHDDIAILPSIDGCRWEWGPGDIGAPQFSEPAGLPGQ